MPWKIFSQAGGKFAVYQVDESEQPIGEPLGIHDSKRKARAQQAALYASENSKSADTLAVKFAQEENTIEGLGIPYGGIFNGKDLAGEQFSPETDLCLDWFPEGRPLLYQHGLDESAKTAVVGRVTGWKAVDRGLWIKAQLDRSSEYFEAIKELIQKGKLFLSSGSMRHLVDVDRRSGHIKRWPWVEMSLTPTPANPLAEVGFSQAAKHFAVAGLKSSWDSAYKAIWSAALINDLPDSAFAYIEPDGEKDGEGKTTPRSLRHFPYRNKEGNLDAAHVRNALSRIPQSDLPQEAKDIALEVVQKAAKELGVATKTLSAPDIDALVPEEVAANPPAGKKPAFSSLVRKVAKDLDVDEGELTVRCGDMSSMSRSQVHKHIEKHAKELVGAKKSVLGAQAGMKSSVAWEDIRCEVDGLLRKRLEPLGNSTGPSCCYVVKTHSTYAIAEVCRDSAVRHYRVPYTLGADGHVAVIGDLVEVEEVYVPAVVSPMPLGMQSEIVKSYVDRLVGQAKAVHQSRLKEGRILSSANRERLQQCLDAMQEACEELSELLESTDPVIAKATTVQRMRRLKMLELYAATL